MGTGLQPAAADEHARDQPAWFVPLWRGRSAVLGLALAAGVAAFIGSLLVSPTYEAVSTLRLVGPPPLEDHRQMIAILSQHLSGVRALVESDSLAAEAMDAFDLDATEGIARSGLRQRITAEQVPGASLMRLRVRMRDAQRAADVANWLAARTVERNGRLHQQDAIDARDRIGAQLDEVREKLADAETRLSHEDMNQGALAAEHEVLLRTYLDLAGRYEAARLRVASRVGELQPLDSALAPDVPIAPRPVLNTVVAAGFGAVFAAIWLFLRDAARSRGR